MISGDGKIGSSNMASLVAAAALAATGRIGGSKAGAAAAAGGDDEDGMPLGATAADFRLQGKIIFGDLLPTVDCCLI